MNTHYKKIGYILLGIGISAIAILLAFSDNPEQSVQKNKSETTFVAVDLYIPDSLSLFGEAVPLQYYDVVESLERELLVNVYFQSQTVQFLKYVHRYFPIIDSILKANNLHTDFKYLALAESGLKVNISPKGAAGFWQFLETTAKEYNMTVTEQIDQRYDLIKSTEAACKYLQRGYSKFNSWTMVAASYNLGMGGLKKQADFQKITSFYDLYTNSETARYVFRIAALKLIIENPEKYGYHEIKPYPSIPYSIVTVDTTITNLQEFAAAQGSNYKLLKTMNPWLRDKYLPNEQRIPYHIIIIKNSDRILQK